MRDLASRYPHVCVIVLILTTLAGYVGGVRYYAEEARKQAAFDQARIFLDSIIGFHQYYSKAIVPRIKASGGRFQLDFLEDPESFPFPASVLVEFGKALQAVNPKLDTKLYSNFPFPVQDPQKLHPFEQVSLAVLLASPEEDFAQFEIRNGIETIRYARTMVMRQGCVDCHSRPEFGFQGKWKVGDVRGARQVSIPVSNVEPILDMATIAAMFIAVFATITGWFVVQPVVGRLRRSLSESETLAAEKRELAKALNLKNAALQSTIQANKRLLAGVSHDPQTPIVGNSHLSGSASVNPETQPQQETDGAYTPDSNLHLSSSIGELHEIPMGEEGDWQPDEKLIDLPKFLKSIRPMLQASLADVSITLSILDAQTWRFSMVMKARYAAFLRLSWTMPQNIATAPMLKSR
jgi:hypothetical protein